MRLNEIKKIRKKAYLLLKIYWYVSTASWYDREYEIIDMIINDL